MLKAIRAERGDRTVFLDGGDTWQNSFTSMQTKGQDMVDCMALLKPDAMVGHWEFTLGAERVKELKDKLGFPFLAQNVRDTEWNEPAFDAMTMIERGGVKIAVIGQAFPYTPIANPRWMIPTWSFGIREEDLQGNVEKARKDGAQLVVLLSHNGFDVDRKLAGRVRGIDVILTGHTHDALPDVVKVGKTLLIASGSHGKFLSRLDLDVRGGEVKDYRYKLIPIFSDAIAPDAEMAAKIAAIRAPHEKMLRETIGRTETLLYRRGNFNGTLDDVICDALLAERDAEIALSPGFRWGNSLLAGPGHHPRGHLQRHRPHLSRRLPHDHDRRAAQGGAGGRGRQPLQPRSLLSAGRRHGPRRRRVLHHRPEGERRTPHRRSHAAQDRQAARSGQGIRRHRLGQRQRRHRRPGDLGRGDAPHRKEEDRRAARSRACARGGKLTKNLPEHMQIYA